MPRPRTHLHLWLPLCYPSELTLAVQPEHQIPSPPTSEAWCLPRNHAPASHGFSFPIHPQGGETTLLTPVLWLEACPFPALVGQAFSKVLLYLCSQNSIALPLSSGCSLLVTASHWPSSGLLHLPSQEPLLFAPSGHWALPSPFCHLLPFTENSISTPSSGWARDALGELWLPQYLSECQAHSQPQCPRLRKGYRGEPQPFVPQSVSPNCLTAVIWMSPLHQVHNVPPAKPHLGPRGMLFSLLLLDDPANPTVLWPEVT